MEKEDQGVGGGEIFPGGIILTSLVGLALLYTYN